MNKFEKNNHKNIDRNAFAVALKKGLGRAKLHIIHHGLDNVSDIVLDACLHDLSYDPQCESSRAQWLFAMFGDAKEFPLFRDSILNALAIETNTWDLQQLFELTKLIAGRGDNDAQLQLRRHALEIAQKPSDSDWLGAEELIELDGVDGFIELAKIYGQRLLDDPEDFVSDNLIFRDDDNAETFKEILYQQAKQEPQSKAYWDYLQKRRVFEPRKPIDRDAVRRQSKIRVRQQYPLDRIINDAREGKGQYPGYYVNFGRHATPSELQQIYSLLLNETDTSIQLRFLWVFRRTEMPQLYPRLFDWANGTNEPLRSASIAALSQISDKQVHTFARKKIQNNELTGPDNEAIYLFINNYENGDAQLITQSLSILDPDDEDTHSLAYNVIELADKQNDPNLAGAMKWVYHNTPCTNCRYSSVIHLDKFKQLEDSLVQECLFDASEEIRTFAQQLLNQ